MEQQDIVKRLKDLDSLAAKRQMICYSDFLNTEEFSSYLTNQHLFHCDIMTFSEIADLERQMIAFIPDALSFEPDYPISILKICYKSRKYAQKLTHRDILGALMGLGIERKLIGDIWVAEEQCVFLAHEKMKDYLIDTLHQINRTEVYLEEIDVLPGEFKPKFQEMSFHIASMRLDCIVSEFARCSRSVSEKYIKQGHVFVNSKEIIQGSYTCKDGDKISVRGIGKMIVLNKDGETKKGKLVLKIKKYC